MEPHNGVAREVTSVELAFVNFLRQTRDTERLDSEELRVLADQFNEFSLLHPPHIARFSTRRRCQNHLRYVSRVWDLENPPRIDDLVICPDGSYLVVASGERRLRAYELDGKQSCEFVVIWHDPSPGLVFGIQQVENMGREQVRGQRQARALIGEFRMLRRRDPGLTIAKYARKKKISPSTVSRALRYGDAPDEVHELCEAGLITYTTACQLSRLNGKVPDKRIVHLAAYIRADGSSASEVRALINRQIEEADQDTPSLFGEIEDQALGRQTRRVIRRDLVAVQHRALARLEAVLRLADRGAIGPGAEFSGGSASRLSRREIRLYRDWLRSPAASALSTPDRVQVIADLDLVEQLSGEEV